MRYPVTLTPDDGQFTVTFPDVPEAVTFGETRAEALQRAPDALLTVFDAFMKDRRDIPAPSRATGDAIELPTLDSAKIELYRAMRSGKIGKAELARRLRWHLPQVDRVLKVRHGSQLDQMEAAFAALGKRLVISIVDSDSDARSAPRLVSHQQIGESKYGKRPQSNVPARRKWRRNSSRPSVHPGVIMHATRSSRPHDATTRSAVRRSAARKAAKKR
jgi:antitoxin HicB